MEFVTNSSINKNNYYYNSPSLENNNLYVGSKLGAYCLDVNTGKLIWNFTSPDYVGSTGATYPVYSDGVLYLGWNGPHSFNPTLNHDFYALNAQTGTKIWSYNLPYIIFNTPTVSENTVFVGASSTAIRSPDPPARGAIIALYSNIAQSNDLQNDFAQLVIFISVLIAAGLLIYFKKGKNKAM